MEENKSEEIMNLTETKKNISKTKFLSKSKLLKNKFKKLSISGARKKGQKIVEIIQQNNKYENIPKIIKIRNTGVDVIRIIAMYSVVIHHLIYQFNGIKKYSKYERQIKIFDHALFWHINGFALISGIVGYKTNKYSNLFYLWLEIVFYRISIYFYFYKTKHISNINLSEEYFPIIYRKHWYFTAYFGMYLYLPIINKGISLISKSEFKLVVASTIGIFSIWKKLKNPKNDIFILCGGSSVFWLLIVYIIGAYIGIYKVEYSGIKKYIFCLVCLFIYLVSTFIYYKLENKQLYNGKKNILNKLIIILSQLFSGSYDSLIRIVQAISLTLFFLQINFNKYLSIIISFIGRFSFSVYLLHYNNLIVDNIMKNVFNKEPNNLTLISVIKLILFKSLKIFFICILVDYLRHLLFNILRIRKLCILFEKIAFKIFG